MSMDFERLVTLLPVKWQTALGMGMSHFINQQEPEQVEFEVRENGYMIKVYTDVESSQEAREFWEEYVHDKL